MFLRRTCEWSTEARVLSEKGLSIFLVYLKPPRVCSSYTKENLASFNPCRLTNVTQGTACKGLLSKAKQDKRWELTALASHPDDRPGQSAVPKQIQYVDDTVDQLQLTCDDLTGFASAKAIQRSSVYQGTASVTCRVTQQSYSVMMVTGDNVHFTF